MYLPAPFRREDGPELRAFMRAHAFVTLVSLLDGELVASPLPVTLAERAGGLVLEGHLARANSHTRAFVRPGSGSETPLEPNPPESLVLFGGPHAYVSPRHYAARASVPTWNYQAVHAYGVPQAVEDAAGLERLLAALIAEHEPEYGAQWNGLSERYRSGMLRGIVGFELRVTRLYAKDKLSQNRPRADRERVAAALGSEDDKDARALGMAMRRTLEKG